VHGASSGEEAVACGSSVRLPVTLLSGSSGSWRGG
jgi:hypothetical protein